MSLRPESDLVHHQSSLSEMFTLERRGLRPHPHLFLIRRDEPDYAGLTIFDPALPPCPTPRTHEEVVPMTGEIVKVPNRCRDDRPLRCGSNACPTCVVINAQRFTYAIMLSQPTHSFSITLVGADYTEISFRMSALLKILRRIDPSFQWVWAVEENPEHTGLHIHGFCYVDLGHRMIYRRTVIEALIEAGFCLDDGRVPLWALEKLMPPLSAEYIQYPMKTLIDPALAPRFLELNGTAKRRQLIHPSRGFWRDGAWGRKLTLREAKRISYQRSRSSNHS